MEQTNLFADRRFDVHQFNKVFSDHYAPAEEEKQDRLQLLRHPDRVVRELVVFQEPDAMHHSKQAYASLDGQATSYTGKAFTDLYEAYTDRHPEELQARPASFQSLEEAKKQRAQSIEPTQTDQLQQRQLEQIRQKQEEERLSRVLRRDEFHEQQHQKLHQRLTVFR